jgi:hypothetical protein
VNLFLHVPLTSSPLQKKKEEEEKKKEEKEKEVNT